MVLAMVAEQNMDILEEIETMKNDFKGAFPALAEHIEKYTEAILDDFKEMSALNKRKARTLRRRIGRKLQRKMKRKLKKYKTKVKLRNLRM